MRAEALEVRLSEVGENISAVPKSDYDRVGISVYEHHFSRHPGVDCTLFQKEVLLSRVPGGRPLRRVPVNIHKLLANYLIEIVVPIPLYAFGTEIPCTVPPVEGFR